MKRVATVLLLASLSCAAQEQARVFDKKLFSAEAIMLAGIAADGITTQQGLARGCRETNPLLGAHPTPRQMAALEVGEAVGFTLATYWLKRITRKGRPGVERRGWLIVPLIVAGGHGFAAAHNASMRCR